MLKSLNSDLDKEYTIKIDINNNKSDLLIPIEELNTSHLNSLLTWRGAVIELSKEFEDNNYGYIQLISLQSTKKYDHIPPIQWGVGVTLKDKYIGSIKLGDKVQITGVLRIFTAHSSTPRNYCIITNNIKILNEEELISLSEQDIKNIKTLAKIPLVPIFI